MIINFDDARYITNNFIDYMKPKSIKKYKTLDELIRDKSVFMTILYTFSKYIVESRLLEVESFIDISILESYIWWIYESTERPEIEEQIRKIRYWKRIYEDNFGKKYDS